MKAEEIEDAIIRITESGCWIWMRGTVKRDGYGRINGTTAHKFVYQELVGKVPNGLELDHLCRVRCCVNPSHLEPVTQQVNMARGFSPHAINSRKTHCSKGHEFTTENTMYRKNGGRSCKTCESARYAKYYVKAKDKISKRMAIYYRNKIEITTKD